MWHDVPKLAINQTVMIPEANLLKGKCAASQKLERDSVITVVFPLLDQRAGEVVIPPFVFKPNSDP